jgi:hypothetical protein
MKLHIDDKKTIGELKDQFNSTFPFLKLEFFNLPHESGKLSFKHDLLDHRTVLANCRTNHSEGDLFFNANTTVEEFESSFQTVFGISVQVYRKSGKVWLQTSTTDSWTLEEQNERGSFMEKEVGE